MEFLDTIRLGGGNSLIMGNCPKELTPEIIVKKNLEEQRETESFGLFDTAQPNYTTYYPELDVEDLTPNEGEFIHPIFRALSAVVVHRGWNPVDFGKPGVLKNSMSLLQGQSIHADHETAIGNAMGSVYEVFWENSYKTKSGLIVPSGINAKLKLDGKSNPRICRGIMMDPPSIHSTSVTVQFLWEKSHPQLSDDEFFRGLGTFDKDGKMITRVATKIKRYNEISLVAHGADPYAQLIKEGGEINNPLWADVSYNSAHPGKNPATKFFFFDFKSDLVNNSETATPTNIINNNSEHQTSDMDQTFLLALAALMGLDIADPTKITQDSLTADLGDLVKRYEAAVAQNTSDTTLIGQLQEQIKAIPPANADVAKLTAFQVKLTGELSARVQKAYTLAMGDKVSPTMVSLIQNADYDTLTALGAQYELEADKAHPLTCKDCGSTAVNRASSAPGNSGEGDPKNKLSLNDTARAIAKKKSNTNISFIHGKKEANK